MPSSPSELIDQLADRARRNAARDELVKLGAEAAPFLLRAAENPRDPEHYKMILRALLHVQDPRSQDLFRRALTSNDADVRALGARGLHLLKAPDALDALRATINDDPDPLHSQRTPAVQSLIESGLSALPATFVLMESANEETRRRAQYVLASIVLEDITRRLQPSALTNEALRLWEELQRQNGSYAWNGSESARRSSIELWRGWYERAL
jgi:HEAT repeat protein